MKATEYITITSKRLVDNELGYTFTTWSQEDLLLALRWSLSALGSLARAAFVKWHTVQVRPGEHQDVCSECDEITQLGSLFDKNSSEITDMQAVGSMPAGLKKIARLCIDCEEDSFDLLSATISGPTTVTLFPPVPDDSDYSMTVQCFRAPMVNGYDDEVEIPRYLQAAVLELMMYYGHMYDIEAVPSRDRAKVHYDVALQLIRGG